MDGERDFTARELAGLLEWWVEAGVDVAVQEEARSWLKPAQRCWTEREWPFTS